MLGTDTLVMDILTLVMVMGVGILVMVIRTLSLVIGTNSDLGVRY